jgi:hypothetical protein
MPTCNSTALSEIFKSCNSNSGGILEFYLIDQEDVTSVEVDVTGHTVTGMTTTVDFTTFEIRRNTASAAGANPIDFTNGSTYFTNTVTLAFHRREAAKSRAIQILGEGQRYVAAIYRDSNNLYWYLDYLQLQSNDDTTGTARADGSNYTTVLFGESEHSAYQIDEAVVQSVI